MKKSETLFQQQWSIGHQHLLLEDLICGRSNKISTTKQICSQFSLFNEPLEFTESHKVFGHNDYHVGEFLKALRQHPKYLAYLLVRSEKCCTQMASPQLISGVDNQTFFSNQQLLPIVFQSIYGNCILYQDEKYCLQLLKYLIEMQFSSGSASSLINFNEASSNVGSNEFYTNIDLRKLIRKQSCSFNIIFSFYTSFVFSAQLFLHTSLHEPITQILGDEWYLDVDPDKALGRFTQEEIINQ